MATTLTPPTSILEASVPTEPSSSSIGNMSEEIAGSQEHQKQQRQEAEGEETGNVDEDQHRASVNEDVVDGVHDAEDDEDEDSPPSDFICPLTLEIMSDPLMTCKNHMNFERSAIVEWLNRGNTTCPLTREPLSYSKLVPNAALRLQIEQWKRDKGIPVSKLRSKRDKWNEEIGGKISFCLQNMSRNDGSGNDHEEGDFDDDDYDESNAGFSITVASAPLTYHQQLFMVAALGQDYTLEQRRQLMEEYHRSTGGLFYDDQEDDSDRLDDDDDLPIATMIYGQGSSDASESSSRRRRNRHLRQHRRGGRRGGSSSTGRRHSSSDPSSTRQRNAGNTTIGISPRRRRRLLSVIDNALSMLRGTDAPNL